MSKSSTAKKIESVEVLHKHPSAAQPAQRTRAMRGYLQRIQHLLDVATVILLAEVAANGRCAFWLVASRVFRTPEVTKVFDGKVGEQRVYKTLTFAWRMGAFEGLGLVYKPGAGLVPEVTGEAPAAERTAQALAEARGRERAEAQVGEELLAVEQAAFEKELVRLRRAAGLS